MSMSRTARTIVHLIVPVYVVVVLMILGAVAYSRIQLQNFKDEEAHRLETDRDLLLTFTEENCHDRNVTKEAVRGTIDAALRSEGRRDLTRVPSFKLLPPEMQQFVRDISNPGNPTAADNLRAYRETLVDEDCKALVAEFERNLRLQDD